jgi:hypothetical protein
MDGNGRLSRFLFHHSLCRAHAISDGLILPVSIALKQNERGYLAALETFSKPARTLWGVQWIDGASYVFEAKCSNAVYRYWDATAQVEFALQMAHEAVDVHLRGEVAFLSSFDKAIARINARVDLASPLLHMLVVMCRDNHGALSRNRRRQFADRVPEDYFGIIEEEVRAAFALSPPAAEAP